MVTTGFWLSFLLICCLYPLQAYVFKANSKIPMCSGIAWSGAMQAQGGEHQPLVQETKFPPALVAKTRLIARKTELLKEVFFIECFVLFFGGFLHNMFKDITQPPASSIAPTRKVLLIFTLSHSPQHHQPKSVPPNSPCTFQPSLFTVTCYKTFTLRLQ